jgi:hypothetical protein
VCEFLPGNSSFIFLDGNFPFEVASARLRKLSLGIRLKDNLFHQTFQTSPLKNQIGTSIRIYLVHCCCKTRNNANSKRPMAVQELCTMLAYLPAGVSRSSKAMPSKKSIISPGQVFLFCRKDESG